LEVTYITLTTQFLTDEAYHEMFIVVGEVYTCW